MATPDVRSKEACPECSAYELAIIDFPDIAATPYLPATEVLAGRMGKATGAGEPAIGCLACGAQWTNLAAFRSATAGATSEGHGA